MSLRDLQQLTAFVKGNNPLLITCRGVSLLFSQPRVNCSGVHRMDPLYRLPS